MIRSPEAVVDLAGLGCERCAKPRREQLLLA